MFNTTTARIHIGAQATMDGERAFRDGVPYEDADWEFVLEPIAR